MSQSNNTAPRVPKILRMRQLVEAVGLSRTSIHRLMSKGLFPKGIRIGINAVGWELADVEFWLFERRMASAK
jgi:prophage regulatory protein